MQTSDASERDWYLRLVYVQWTALVRCAFCRLWKLAVGGRGHFSVNVRKKESTAGERGQRYVEAQLVVIGAEAPAMTAESEQPCAKQGSSSVVGLRSTH